MLKKLITLLLKATIVFLILSVCGTLLFRFVDPPCGTVMAFQSVSASPANPKGELKQTWMPLDGISCDLVRAVIAAEDQKFEHHMGFDMDAITSAFEHNMSGKRLRGGSTISQQTVKNLFLWHGRSFVRKGFEAYFTLLIESMWSKRRIMEVYLNIIEMGDGIYGAEGAANAYFHKQSQDLTKQESALLAAILPSPRKRNPAKPSPRLLKKQAWILDQMGRMASTTLCK